MTFMAGMISISMIAAFIPISMNPYDELQDLNRRIPRLRDEVEQKEFAVRGLREHRISKMQEYGITVTPPLAVLKRDFPQLYSTEKYLKSAQEDLDKLETRLTLSYKRRKELQIQLGIRPDEIPTRKSYTVMKKFNPPTERR
jgi:hypothetical protein